RGGRRLRRLFGCRGGSRPCWQLRWRDGDACRWRRHARRRRHCCARAEGGRLAEPPEMKRDRTESDNNTNRRGGRDDHRRTRRLLWRRCGRRPLDRIGADVEWPSPGEAALDVIDKAVAERRSLDPLLVREHVFEPTDRVGHIDAERQDWFSALLRQL